jgi:hypothetical protein
MAFTALCPASVSYPEMFKGVSNPIPYHAHHISFLSVIRRQSAVNVIIRTDLRSKVLLR